MKVEDIFQISVKGIIINQQNQILLLQANDNGDLYWDLPGGRVHINEKFKKTLYREIAEETGIDALIDTKYLGLVTSIKRISHKDHKTVGLIYAVYTAKLPENQPIVKLSTEHFHFEWAHLEDAIPKLFQGYGQELCDIVIQHFNSINMQ